MINEILNAQKPFIAGQLRYCLHEWQQITSDSFVLQCVTNCIIEFDCEPSHVRSTITNEHKFPPSQQQTIDKEIETFLHKGIIELRASEPGEVISPIFVRPKKEPGTFRVIFNLKILNETVTYHKFKMYTIESAIRLMKQGFFMSSIDLKDAYYSVPIAPSYRKFLKFVWRDRFFQFTALPMGLTSSPRIFTKILKPVFATLRTQFGNSCLGYIDDSYYTEDTLPLCQEATLHAVELFSRLGFVIHPTKSVLHPTQSLEFLGFILDSVCMRVTITNKKVCKIVTLCQEFLCDKQFSIRQVASIIGTLVSTFPGVKFGPLHYRTLEREKDVALKDASGNFEEVMSLSPESKSDLQWWVSSLPSAYRNIDHGVPDVTLTTDASQLGWWATNGIANTQGFWAPHEGSQHINVLEFLAVKSGLEALLPQAQNLHLRIVSDNMTTVAYINAMGGCKATACDTLAKEIWSWAVMRNIWLSAAHISGKQNILTDSLSRKFNPDVEWELNSHTFDDIAVHFGMPDIDLFANRLNHKVPLYVSWKADPHASYVDAFALDWAQFTNGYAFPPFCLISRCLQNIVLEQATLIMLVPMWYTQAWFTRLLSLLIDHLRVIKVTKGTLRNPLYGDVHPLSPKLQLMASRDVERLLV